MSDKQEKKTRKPRVGTPVTIIVEREFVGEKTLEEAFIPVIVEDLRRKLMTNRNLDKLPDAVSTADGSADGEVYEDN